MTHPLLTREPGDRHLLLGNEAIVRGALEAGVAFVTCYPGTPSSEIPDTFFRLAPRGEYYFEYCANEKVALEVGGGAALAGAATLVTMKHVGVNVAADPLMTLAYIGTPGGLVLVSADDPACHSSQNEQDNRYYARLAGLPVFEPCTAQQAKDMTRDAFALSRRLQQPVLLRTTTRLAHLRGPVDFGPLQPITPGPVFEKNPTRFVPIPAVARQLHPQLVQNLEKARKDAETSPYNTTQGSGTCGVIASGMSRAYLTDIIQEKEFADTFALLQLGQTFPLPEKKITAFLQTVDKVLIIEEGEPLLEDAVRVLAQKTANPVQIAGKGNTLTPFGEFDTRLVRTALYEFLGKTPPQTPGCPVPEELPLRPPNLCAGCGHRDIFYSLRKCYGDDAIYSSDIGCYTLGILPPLSMADFLLCMGSSVSAGGGFAMAQDKPVVALIGDSTFFHSGITGLVSAVFNNHDLLLVISDNHTTAMTGHQPHPGVAVTLHGDNPRQVDIETIVRGCGVQQVRKVQSRNYTKTIEVIKELKALSGVRVLIAEEPCVIFARRILKKASPRVAYAATQDEELKKCLEELACPAYMLRDGTIEIDEQLCTGCMFCVQLCDSVKSRKRS